MLKICKVSPQVAGVFAMTNMQRHIEIFPDETLGAEEHLAATGGAKPPPAAPPPAASRPRPRRARAGPLPRGTSS